jgi:hypothetical protein
MRVACGVVFFAACYWQYAANFRTANGDTARGNATEPATAPVRPASIHRQLRPIYPHSIIPGGAYSSAELRDALDRDPVAAAHYSGFHTSVVRVKRLETARLAYLSYRIGEEVRWTRNAVALPADEAVLSDGENLARARCGNRISFTPRQPVGPDVDLDTPEPALSDNLFDPRLVVYDVFSPPQMGLGEWTIPLEDSFDPEAGAPELRPLDFGPLLAAVVPPDIRPPSPPTETPEPASWVLCPIGLTALAILANKKNQKSCGPEGAGTTPRFNV